MRTPLLIFATALVLAACSAESAPDNAAGSVKQAPVNRPSIKADAVDMPVAKDEKASIKADAVDMPVAKDEKTSIKADAVDMPVAKDEKASIKLDATDMPEAK
jgi:hypothetical protein